MSNEEIARLAPAHIGIPEPVGRLLKGVKFREAPGVEQTWKPKPGDTLAGECVETRREVGPNKQDILVVRGRTVTPDGEINDGTFTVWLTADLRMRKAFDTKGNLVVIYYEGMIDTPSGPYKGRPMHRYRLYEVLPGGAET